MQAAETGGSAAPRQTPQRFDDTLLQCLPDLLVYSNEIRCPTRQTSHPTLLPATRPGT